MFARPRVGRFQTTNNKRTLGIKPSWYNKVSSNNSAFDGTIKFSPSLQQKYCLQLRTARTTHRESMFEIEEQKEDTTLNEEYEKDKQFMEKKLRIEEEARLLKEKFAQEVALEKEMLLEKEKQFLQEKEEETKLSQLQENEKMQDILKHDLNHQTKKLQQCIKLQNYDDAERVIQEIEEHQLNKDIVYYSTTIDLYANHLRNLEKADLEFIKVIDYYKEKTNNTMNSSNDSTDAQLESNMQFCFNSLISLYAHNEMPNEAVSLLEEMKILGIKLNEIGFTTISRILRESGNIKHLRRLTSLINEFGNSEEKVFSLKFLASIISSSSISDVHKYEEIIDEQNITPDAPLLRSIFFKYISASDYPKSSQYFAKILEYGAITTEVITSYLRISMSQNNNNSRISKILELIESNQFLRELHLQSEVNYDYNQRYDSNYYRNKLQSDNYDDGDNENDPNKRNAQVDRLIRQKQIYENPKDNQTTHKEKYVVDTILFNTILKASEMVQNSFYAQSIYNTYLKRKLVDDNETLSLISSLIKLSNLYAAEYLSSSLSPSSISSLTPLPALESYFTDIVYYTKIEDMNEKLEEKLISTLQSQNIDFSAELFNEIMIKYTSNSKVEEAERVLEQMQNKYSIPANQDSYDIIIQFYIETKNAKKLLEYYNILNNSTSLTVPKYLVNAIFELNLQLDDISAIKELLITMNQQSELSNYNSFFNPLQSNRRHKSVISDERIIAYTTMLIDLSMYVDPTLFNFAIYYFIDKKDTENAMKFFYKMIEYKNSVTDGVISKLIELLCNDKERMQDAVNLFFEYSNQCSYSRNLINIFIQHFIEVNDYPHFSKSLSILHQNGFPTEISSLQYQIDHCIATRDVELAEQIISDLRSSESSAMLLDSTVYSRLISLYITVTESKKALDIYYSISEDKRELLTNDCKMYFLKEFQNQQNYDQIEQILMLFEAKKSELKAVKPYFEFLLKLRISEQKLESVRHIMRKMRTMNLNIEQELRWEISKLYIAENDLADIASIFRVLDNFDISRDDVNVITFIVSYFAKRGIAVYSPELQDRLEKIPNSNKTPEIYRALLSNYTSSYNSLYSSLIHNQMVTRNFNLSQDNYNGLLCTFLYDDRVEMAGEALDMMKEYYEPNLETVINMMIGCESKEDKAYWPKRNESKATKFKKYVVYGSTWNELMGDTEYNGSDVWEEEEKQKSAK